MTSLAEKKQALRPALRNVLLILLIGLPFLLYVAMQSGWTGIAWALSGVLALSMAVLVWLG
jgi:small-conductance mechanosensitive channel